MFRIAMLGLISAIPGWPVRRALYRLFFGYQFGERARIGMFSIVDAAKLTMADGAQIRGFKNLILNLNELDMGSYASIGGPRFGGDRIQGTAHKPGYPSSVLRMGPCSIIGLEHYFDLCADITLGANVIVGGFGTYFFTHSFRKEFEPIVIGDGVYIGSHCRFQMGVKVADGCVIAMGAVVAKSIDTPNAIAGGVPAKVISEHSDYDAQAVLAARRRPYFDGERVILPAKG